jgi:hypothetical protein
MKPRRPIAALLWKWGLPSLVVLAAAAITAWCYLRFRPPPPPPFAFDPNQPFILDFGQLPGNKGPYMVISVASTGEASFKTCVGGSQEGEEAVFELSDEEIRGISESIVRNRVSGFRNYVPEHGCGPLYVLRIRQGEKWKTVYFSYQIPDEAVGFRKEIWQLVDKRGGRNMPQRPIASHHVTRALDEILASMRED